MAVTGSDVEVPHDYTCPISLEIMSDPVRLVETSNSFERENIEQWFRTGKRTCPSTNQVLKSTHFIPNIALRNAIQEWAKQHSMGLPPAPSPTSHLGVGDNSDSHRGSSAVAPNPLLGSLVPELRQRAEQGHASAQYALGVRYDNGTDVRKSRRRAMEWFRRAAMQGHAIAQFNLSLCYAHGIEGEGKDEARAMEWLRKAAEQGYATAQCDLGRCYLNDTGVGKNKRRSMEWFHKAAEQGHATAQFILSVCYADGIEGEGKDEARAMEWLRTAAEQGYARAQCDLGTRYWTGTGVSKNERRAMEWFRKAAEQGHATAQFKLSVCYANGILGVGKDEACAMEWRRKAANQGHASAQSNLGLCYSEGRGVAKDDLRAVEWYRKAAEQGDAYGQANLAEMLMEGRGCMQDWALASRLLKSSVKSDSNQLRAKLTLAWLLWTGQGGIRVSKRRAKRLCESVCNMEDYETCLGQFWAAGWTWPAVLFWFRERKWSVRFAWF